MIAFSLVDFCILLPAISSLRSLLSLPSAFLSCCQRGLGERRLSLESEPAGQVVAQCRPGCFLSDFEEAATAKLPQAAAFFNPGVGKLGKA